MKKFRGKRESGEDCELSESMVSVWTKKKKKENRVVMSDEWHKYSNRNGSSNSWLRQKINVCVSSEESLKILSLNWNSFSVVDDHPHLSRNKAKKSFT